MNDVMNTRPIKEDLVHFYLCCNGKREERTRFIAFKRKFGQTVQVHIWCDDKTPGHNGFRWVCEKRWQTPPDGGSKQLLWAIISKEQMPKYSDCFEQYWDADEMSDYEEGSRLIEHYAGV
jgi:hypothetical protein